tara:strand:- start:924 stop:1739 length:816 start_codon:yes stop_codon:yes gene_type:complete
MSCASCHIPEQGFTDNSRPTATGIDGSTLRRNTPTLLNVFARNVLFHDGRETSLDTQAITPLLHPQEMGNPVVGVLEDRLRRLKDYEQTFTNIYGDLSIENIALALAAFARTLNTNNSAFDRWTARDVHALSTTQKTGFGIFNRHGCGECHLADSDFTEDAFHNTGVTRSSDLSRFEVTQDTLDRYRFRTPTLRNIGLTAPYMHNGSIPTLEGVVHFYATGNQREDPSVDARMLPFSLSDNDLEALLSFLNALTDSSDNPRWSWRQDQDLR